MPKRMSTVRYDSPEIQGEGSYVELRLFTWGEMKERGLIDVDMEDDAEIDTIPDKKAKKKAQKAKTEKVIVLTEQVFAERVVGWNWVDEGGKPLPLPAEDPDVLNMLTTLEITFLTSKIVGGDVEVKKNKKD